MLPIFSILNSIYGILYVSLPVSTNIDDQEYSIFRITGLLLQASHIRRPYSIRYPIFSMYYDFSRSPYLLYTYTDLHPSPRYFSRQKSRAPPPLSADMRGCGGRGGGEGAPMHLCSRLSIGHTASRHTASH
jgi:hypothetical protein